MAEDTIPRTKRDGTLTFADNAGANTLVVTIEAGDFSWNAPQDKVTNVLDRGQMGAPPYIRLADEQPMTFSFTGVMRELTDATDATLMQLLHNGGKVGTGWVSTMGANGEVDTWSLTWAVEGVAHGSANHTMTLPYCYITGSVKEGDPNIISISGTSYSRRPTSIS